MYLPYYLCNDIGVKLADTKLSESSTLCTMYILHSGAASYEGSFQGWKLRLHAPLSTLKFLPPAAECIRR